MSHANSTLVSIVLTNYNYGHYLRQAIDSAINQTYQFIEVIVVDDGSTDNSKDILESYRGQISVHYNDRTGQCGAINTGFVNSKGSVVIFLDSDDYLEAKAVESHLSNFFVNPDICKSQGYMRCVDAKGKFLQSIFPNRLSASGYYRKQVINQGPWVVRHAWTSGNAWRRAFLQCVLPLPENRKHINSPDGTPLCPESCAQEKGLWRESRILATPPPNAPNATPARATGPALAPLWPPTARFAS